jgi:hypothetical protein
LLYKTVIKLSRAAAENLFSRMIRAATCLKVLRKDKRVIEVQHSVGRT